MAHKTLIGGTAYEITGGKTQIDGTVYQIVNGQALVEGTVHEIPVIQYVWEKYQVESTDVYSVVETKGSGSTAIPNTVYDFGTSAPTVTSAGLWTKTPTSVSKSAFASGSYKKHYVAVIGGRDQTLYWVDSVSTTSFRYSVTYNIEKTTEQSQGAYIADVTSADPDAYPVDGIHTDGYWYIKVA